MIKVQEKGRSKHVTQCLSLLCYIWMCFKFSQFYGVSVSTSQKWLARRHTNNLNYLIGGSVTSFLPLSDTLSHLTFIAAAALAPMQCRQNCYAGKHVNLCLSKQEEQKLGVKLAKDRLSHCKTMVSCCPPSLLHIKMSCLPLMLSSSVLWFWLLVEFPKLHNVSIREWRKM